MARISNASAVIALEEAFLHPKLMELFPAALQQKYGVIRGRLTDVGPERIARMDAAGIDLQVLSHVEPGVQVLDDPALAVRISTEVNDWLGDVVRKYPTRFAGFAALPTQDAEAAARELERTVTTYGFVGALINGHTHGRYLDHESFTPLLERAQALDVPIYIHPTDPPAQVSSLYYDDSPSLITGWGWQVETGTHLLRLIAAGVFDRFPRLKIIVGHMGELIPFCFTRVNTALTMGEWLLSAKDAKEARADIPGRRARMQKSFSYYMKQNIYVTTSGVFDQPVFECALGFLGIDNLLFSVDDPFMDNFAAVEFLGKTRLAPADREKLAHGNAERILRLGPSSERRVKAEASRNAGGLSAMRASAKSRVGRALLSFLLR